MNCYPKGFKVKHIIDYLTWDLLLVLGEILVKETLDRDILDARLLMILSDEVGKPNGACHNSTIFSTRWISYKNKLLFRDFSMENAVKRNYRDEIKLFELQSEYDFPKLSELLKLDKRPKKNVKIQNEAINYLYLVLARRITLANSLKGKPTSMHLLFENLCRHSTRNIHCETATVRRSHNIQSDHGIPTYLKQVAYCFRQQRSVLDSNYGKISQRRRQEYGPIWLCIDKCAIEMPEELSLFDILEALPIPLNPDFTKDSDLQLRLNRVIQTLNKRYGFLRSCGLHPKEWLDRDTPSIAVLEELKHLKQGVNEYIKSNESSDVMNAYRHIFSEQITAGKKYAGCTNFEEFIRTNYGSETLDYSTISMDAIVSKDNGKDPLTYHETISSEESIEAKLLPILDDPGWVQNLINTNPALFDDIMIMFFREAIGVDRPLVGDNTDHPLLQDIEFNRLLQSNPYYQGLDNDELTEILLKKASEIIEKGRHDLLHYEASISEKTVFEDNE